MQEFTQVTCSMRENHHANSLFELNGRVAALDILLTSLIRLLPPQERTAMAKSFDVTSELAASALLGAHIPEYTVEAFLGDVERWRCLLAGDFGPSELPEKLRPERPD